MNGKGLPVSMSKKNKLIHGKGINILKDKESGPALYRSGEQFYCAGCSHWVDKI
jgi:hypothetical protein